MSIPNSNNKYQNSDSSSIYNVKQNVNSFLADFAEVDFANVIKNNKIYTYNLSGGNYKTNNWTCNGMFNSTYKTNTVSGVLYPAYLNTNLVSGGTIEQNITYDLRPNTSYTFITYGSASVTGAIEVSVYSTITNEVINLDTNYDPYKVSFILGSVSGGFANKHITTFKTNASIVNGPIYVRIKNISTQSVNLNIFDTILYSGLIELGNLPPNKNLPIQPKIVPGVTYIDTIYDETGIAVDGTPVINTGYLQDFYTNRKYNFVALNNEFYLHELNYDETREPANPLGIKINNILGNTSYYLRVVNKNLELEEIDFSSSIQAPTIKDFENGCTYSLQVSGGEVQLVQNSYSIVDTVYTDTVTNKKYILVAEDAALKIIETDASCLENSDKTYKTMKDLYNGKKYTLTVSAATLVTTEVTASTDSNAFYHIKDYNNNLDYNLVIENGDVHIVEAYNLSLDEMFTRLNVQDTKFDELYVSDVTLKNDNLSLHSILDGHTSTLNGHTSTLNGHTSTLDSHTNLISNNTVDINSLVVSATNNIIDINNLSVSSTIHTNSIIDLTTFKNGFTNSTGYQKFPSGIIIQWGSYVVGDGSGNFTVPLNTTFPSACLAITVGRFGTNPLAMIPHVHARGAGSSFTIGVTEWNGGISGADTAVEWIAIGY